MFNLKVAVSKTKLIFERNGCKSSVCKNCKPTSVFYEDVTGPSEKEIKVLTNRPVLMDAS